MIENLKKPFPEQDIEWRIGRSGLKSDGSAWATCLAYISARAVMDRFDEVFGVGGWSVKFDHIQGGVMCTISVKIDGEWVSKQDGSDESDMEAFKGGISGALKRAAVMFGVGRYLYSLDEGFAQIVDQKTKGARYAKDKKSDKVFYWVPPGLPDWAVPHDVKNPEVVDDQPLTRADAEAMNAHMKKNRVSMETVVTHMKDLYGKDRISALNRMEYNAVFYWIGE